MRLRIDTTVEEIRDRSGNGDIEGVLCDFSSLAQVKHLSVDLHSRLEVLLTNLLVDLLTLERQSRIVNVSSMVHAGEIDLGDLQLKESYSGSKAYCLSKLCDILFTYKLADDLKKTGTTVNCLYPGVIGTKLLHTNWGGSGAPVSEGAKTPVYLATSSEVQGETGKYFVNRKAAKSAPVTYDREVQEKLWSISLGYGKDYLCS